MSTRSLEVETDEGAQELQPRQLTSGVELYPTILSALEPWARKLDVELPRPI